MKSLPKDTADGTRSLFVEKQTWRLETVPASLTGLDRDMTVYRARRKSSLIAHKHHGDVKTFCPPTWYDLAIASGACGLGCRACFLMLTFRSFRDPLRPLLYENVEDFWKAARKWLLDRRRRPRHTLGLGIDRADSLLFEGVTEHARHLIPMFSDPDTNPNGNYLILLTKTANARYLEGLPTKNVAVTFSLNPEPIADLWEGKWPDTGLRITRPIRNRLEACLHAQKLGFETRFRIDPILYPTGWKEHYQEFFKEASSIGLKPRQVTLGTYREKTPQLDTWRAKWGLPPMEWEPEDLEKDGTHRHVGETTRLDVYHTVASLARKYLPDSRIALCKETRAVRKAAGLCNADCNCLPPVPGKASLRDPR